MEYKETKRTALKAPNEFPNSRLRTLDVSVLIVIVIQPLFLAPFTSSTSRSFAVLSIFATLTLW